MQRSHFDVTDLYSIKDSGLSPDRKDYLFYMETTKFEELDLFPEIEKAVRYMGFEEASPIQAKAIPAMISGRDIIGQAQTGTGKPQPLVSLFCRR